MSTTTTFITRVLIVTGLYLFAAIPTQAGLTGALFIGDSIIGENAVGHGGGSSDSNMRHLRQPNPPVPLPNAERPGAFALAALVPLSFGPMENVSLGPPGCTERISCSRAPLDVTAGDFNGDSKVDIATANNGSDDVTVLLGDGGGGLAYKFTGAATGAPAGIAAGKLNGDMVLDLVVSKERTNKIGVFIGNGDGTFQDEVEYDMGSSPEAVVLGDFNNDGKLDVATADLFPDSDTGENTVSVRLGDGNGTFGDRIATAVTGDPFGMAVGKVDAGDTLDLVVSLYSNGQVVALLGDGTGHFTEAEPSDVSDAPRGIALADYNSDGHLDVAVTTEDDDILDVLFGNGDATFQTPKPYRVGGLPESVVAGDFNGDGIVDVATADSFGTLDFDGDVSILVGKGGGEFAEAQQFEVDLGPYGIVAADLNGDRLPELVTANLDSDPPTLSVLRNMGTTASPTVTPSPANPSTYTASSTPSVTATLTIGSSATATMTPVATPINSATPSSTGTAEPIQPPTNTPPATVTSTKTVSPTSTATITRTSTPTMTATGTVTPSLMPTSSSTVTQTPIHCVGDCDHRGTVTINELIIGVDIALDILPVSACPAFGNAAGKVDIAQLIKGVNNALNDCGRG